MKEVPVNSLSTRSKGEVSRSGDGVYGYTSNLLEFQQPILIWDQKSPPKIEVKPLVHTQTFGHGEELGKLIHGDSLDMLRSLLALGQRETVDLAYIDPPFGGGALYSRKVQMRGIDAKTSFNVPAYQDIWSDADYLQFMYERLVLLRELLNSKGSLYLHVDTSQVHYLKVICDEIFGRECFQREIVWRIGWVSGYKSQAKNWIRNHDTILFYTKNPEDFYFKKQFVPYASGYKRRGGAKIGKGHPIEDTWNCSEQDCIDSIQIKSFSGEKTGYPTQKNEALLQRIIESSCPEGGLVLDCFSGSGTTPFVAREMSRRWLAGDINSEAIHTARSRLLANGAGQLSSGFGIYALPEPCSQKFAPTADVGLNREGSEVSVEIKDFSSLALLEAMGRRPKHVTEWKSIVECVLIDLNYDGKVFRMDFSDTPTKPGQVVRGKYNPRSSGRIAVMIVDLLGNELVVAEPESLR